MSFNRLMFGLTIVSVVAFTSTVRAEILIAINKSKQQMIVTLDGRPTYVWPVSTGARGYDTPAGQFKPFRMERDHFSREWDDAPMPNSIFFTQIGHAIHGTYETKNLGRPVSHGCVRLSRADAATLFDLVKRQGMAHTLVMLIGEIPVDRPVSVARSGSGRLVTGSVGSKSSHYAYVSRDRREYRAGDPYIYVRQYAPRGYYVRPPLGW